METPVRHRRDFLFSLLPPSNHHRAAYLHLTRFTNTQHTHTHKHALLWIRMEYLVCSHKLILIFYCSQTLFWDPEENTHTDIHRLVIICIHGCKYEMDQSRRRCENIPKISSRETKELKKTKDQQLDGCSAAGWMFSRCSAAGWKDCFEKEWNFLCLKEEDGLMAWMIVCVWMCLCEWERCLQKPVTSFKDLFIEKCLIGRCQFMKQKFSSVKMLDWQEEERSPDCHLLLNPSQSEGRWDQIPVGWLLQWSVMLVQQVVKLGESVCVCDGEWTVHPQTAAENQAFFFKSSTIFYPSFDLLTTPCTHLTSVLTCCLDKSSVQYVSTAAALTVFIHHFISGPGHFRIKEALWSVI